MSILAATAPHPGRRAATGIAVSLMLHVLVLSVLRPPAPSVAPDARRWAQEITVRLLPPPPPAAPPPKPVAASGLSPVPPVPPRRAQARTPQRSAAPPASIDLPAPADVAVTPSTDPAPADASPRFDADAARSAARSLASTLDEPKSDAPNAQVNRGPRYKESRDQRLARQIQSAGRRNCKDGIPGGLLAPLYLMLDKKDSGCKW